MVPAKLATDLLQRQSALMELNCLIDLRLADGSALTDGAPDVDSNWLIDGRLSHTAGPNWPLWLQPRRRQ